MAHNFKEGILWSADPTGSTAIANHFFISKSGDDGTGDGSQDFPYATIAFAVTQHGTAAGTVYVIGAGQWNEFEIGLGQASLLADGYVEFKGASPTVRINNTGNTAGTFTGIIFNTCRPVGGSRDTLIEKCVFLNSNPSQNGNTNAHTIRDCIFFNSVYTFAGSTSQTPPITPGLVIDNCIFINSNLTPANTTTASGTLRIDNSYFDQNCTITFSAATLPGTWNKNNFRGSFIDFDSSGNPFTRLTDINTDPFYNNESGGDFSLQTNSPHIGFGTNGEDIASFGLGTGFFQGVPALDNAVAANPDVSYSGLGELQVDNGTSQVITLDEVDYGFLRNIPTIRLSGFFDLLLDVVPDSNFLINPNHITCEIRWAGLDDVYGVYYKFRYNEIPSLDNAGLSNGENGYSWAQINKIPAKKWQLRVTLLAEGEYVES